MSAGLAWFGFESGGLDSVDFDCAADAPVDVPGMGFNFVVVAPGAVALAGFAAFLFGGDA